MILGFFKFWKINASVAWDKWLLWVMFVNCHCNHRVDGGRAWQLAMAD
jgi:hypothetical protein